jgi:hypothetical protein
MHARPGSLFDALTITTTRSHHDPDSMVQPLFQEEKGKRRSYFSLRPEREPVRNLYGMLFLRSDFSRLFQAVRAPGTP